MPSIIGENNTFECGSGVLVGLDQLCNGFDDCGAGPSGGDETAVICDSK